MPSFASSSARSCWSKPFFFLYVCLLYTSVSAGHIFLEGTDITEIKPKSLARFRRAVSYTHLVESLNLTLRQGIACAWDAEEGLFMPDFDVTIVYEGNIETQEWLYYEQDGMVVTAEHKALDNG